MYISYDHYRIFYYVAKYRSFTQAAEVLFNNQPNLTRAVKALEAELGCTLFLRSNKGVSLTPDGERLYEHISIAFEHIQAAEEEISQNKGLQRGVVSIGATEIALRCFLLPILNRYRDAYPGIRIKIANISTTQALSMLKNGLIDLAVVTTPMEHSSELTACEVKRYREVAICGEGFRQLASKNDVSLSKLAEYPIVSLGNHSATFAFYLKLFTQHGLPFSPDIEAATADQIVPLVRHNLGIGFVPEDFLTGDSPTNGVYRLTLADPLPPRAISLVKKRAHALSLPAKELERMILDSCQIT